MNETVFDQSASVTFNANRLAHLASLGLDLNGKRVLQTGSGVGKLTGFWEERGCDVTSVELQPENVSEDLVRNPDHKIICRDLRQGFTDLGVFDICFCYGTLYHMADPAKLLTDIAAVASLLCLETRVHHKDDLSLHEYGQFAGADQGRTEPAYVPARDWIMGSLRPLYPHVYVTKKQPQDIEFPREWPSANNLCRAVFIASRTNLLPNDGLLLELPAQQEWLPL